VVEPQPAVDDHALALELVLHEQRPGLRVLGPSLSPSPFSIRRRPVGHARRREGRVVDHAVFVRVDEVLDDDILVVDQQAVSVGRRSRPGFRVRTASPAWIEVLEVAQRVPLKIGPALIWLWASTCELRLACAPM